MAAVGGPVTAAPTQWQQRRCPQAAAPGCPRLAPACQPPDGRQRPAGFLAPAWYACLRGCRLHVRAAADTPSPLGGHSASAGLPGTASHWGRCPQTPGAGGPSRAGGHGSPGSGRRLRSKAGARFAPASRSAAAVVHDGASSWPHVIARHNRSRGGRPGTGGAPAGRGATLQWLPQSAHPRSA